MVNNLLDWAICLVYESQKRCPDRDPSEIAFKFSRKMKLNSADLETLLMGVWAAKSFGLDEDLIQKAHDTCVIDYDLLNDL